MPISVNVSVNGRDITSVHIARISESASRAPGAVHKYAVVEQPILPTRDKEWDEGIIFEHTYGEGLMTCVSKALAALDIK